MFCRACSRFVPSTLLTCALAAIAVVGDGCSPSITSPTGSAPYTQLDVVLGNGPAAANGNTLSVTYTGWLYDAAAPDQKGPQFDASGANLFSFQLGGTSVIDGWNQGLVGMHVGGERRLVIPPTLGYGAKRHGIVPPNATLLFDVRLEGVQ